MRGVLASRGARLGAWLIDFAMCELPLFACMFIVMAITDGGNRMNGNEALAGGLYLVGLAIFVGMSIFQWVLISSRGATLGKGWMGIKIVKLDGADVDFVTGVVLRNWVYQLVGCVPYIGACIKVLGCLAIFADDQRCLHDHIASTRVIEAGSDR